ncbi:MAG TPA: cyclic nucleotide-binding domain-containing protein [Planctomycetota bacterium]|nr:cyclic nucleotide-binding domain-containing protein [Planctomycetota bacterium]
MPASFLDTLDAEARELLLSVASPVSFVPGAVLVRHGEAARGAYILREGSVEAVVTLPGGESLTVATLGPGSVFGEMALIELGTCTATVRAAGPVDGWFVAHEEFRALVSRAQPSALRLQHAVTVVLAAKLAALNTQMLACPAPEDRPARALAATEPLAAVPRSRKASFAAGDFLPRLPVFEKCSAGEIDEIVARAAYLEVPRGHGVFTAGSPASAAFVVVRGAVEIVSMREGRERRVAIVGPGQLVGYLSVLRRAPHSTHAFAREGSTLLEFTADAFHELYFGDSRASMRLRHAVQANLLTSMARTNRALTRLLSQAKLAAAPQAELALEAAYHSQLATASPL